ncbi:hypothetical protein DSM02_1599 [Leeuwenhoekiella polynyae]|uniref:Uncharacterized protein n=1 Tax=Leeuwenhoekiella polynyae TaxID=1550906 RepID=A0A4Q0P859_9FLAO|nr:hypothetical protein DSM02_1599 [Leeuwenhoekiella polynyae]
MSKKITFINQNKTWRLVVPAIGLIVFFTAIFVFTWQDLTAYRNVVDVSTFNLSV